MSGLALAAATLQPQWLDDEPPALGMRNVTLRLPWPAPGFLLACPDSRETCEQLASYEVPRDGVPRASSGGTSCEEPETETAEVISSLLDGCTPSTCNYIDVGCNLGYFAGLAAAHGASVDCYEPTPLWVQSASRMAALNGWDGDDGRVKVHHAAITSAAPAAGEAQTMSFSET
eukprot:7118602-Prymnesium_polylepis.1